MKKRSLFVVLVLISFTSVAQIKLPKLISNGMVLQRLDSIKLWGWAVPQENIKLSFNKREYTTRANNDGEWQIKLPPQQAGGPYEMIFSGLSSKLVLKDVWFGDVWLCSGQSNMELPMSRVIDKYPEIIANANNTLIRQFLVPDEYDFKEARKDFSSGSWVAASPKNVLDFSAVAYFFAMEISKKYNIPIGIINSALGGSPAQAWISERSLQSFPNYALEVKKYKDDHLIKQIEADDQSAANEWYKKLNAHDEGLLNTWRTKLDLSDWKEMKVPGYWSNESIGKVNGVVWFKKEVEVPEGMVGKSAKLILGRIVDADSVFINGEFVGATSYQYPPRRYLFNSGILKKGKNIITVRIVNNSGNGGFVLAKDYQLIAGKDTLDLKGKWKYKLGAKMDVPTPSQTFIRWKSAGLYNAMINPLINYRIKGVLWYQGEANTSVAKEYKDLMQTLISDWRGKWNKAKLPFLFVQLPGYMEESDQPMESNWAELRQQQLELLATTKHTGMAVAIDLGEWNDIHPLNKEDVGKRLALQARSLVYGESKMSNTGPIFKSLVRKGNQLILSFNHIGSRLLAKGGALNYFAIAGADKKYVWAKAEIKGDQIVVWSDGLTTPVFVRYAWADNPAKANLYNDLLLPASPFEASVK